MAEYINRDLFAREVNRLSTTPFNEWDTMGILLLLDTIPTADVKPVVHGEWESSRPDAPMFGFHFCSICGRKRTSPQDNFCPNCGADMRPE